MKKILVSIFTLAMTIGLLQAQNDTMYIMKAGVVVNKYNVNTQVDSVIFYKPTTSTNPINLTLVNIPGGTFTMGSPTTEVDRKSDEVEHQVTLSAFRMSKYEITNAQYAAFLNAKSIGSNGLYTEGAYPTQTLIYASSGIFDWGLHYTGSQWVPVAGYENHPVIRVTWYGATEFATYVGGILPTEAQWEYAARAGTTTPFNTGACLSNAQANYKWLNPYSTCTNTITTYPYATQTIGTYAANAYGLHDMHGNVFEWCSDWYGAYSTTAQTNPTGATTGSDRVIRGGSWYYSAQSCRSAYRRKSGPDSGNYVIGFRVVLVP
jgi:formylglycine-generating enzyme